VEVKKMEDKKDKIQENVRTQLGGMGLYGTTSNEEVAGYRASGDIENSGQLDKGFQKEPGNEGETASFSIKQQKENE
jgi:hypothetical protein